ncbi:hypothetical protein J2X32_003131 [Rheinheimera pacifica]|uniref:hypothetical protein n=1 Tax=Rheinheimera pacifica TaxID=173990 RepID=UPI00285A39FA|nr:hypothetical protein [Rheinheimera pacifica]MDR6984487.1 hypothetical protein [Rheinheimera pacifica]
MKKLTILMVASVLIFSSSALARKTCPEALVQNIQIESDHVLYKQVGYPWRRLGILDEPGTRERLSALLAAQMANKKVTIAYKNNEYSCIEENYTESAHLLRTQND